MKLKNTLIAFSLIIGSTVISLLAIYWILEFMGINVDRQLWLTRTQLFGPEKVGIWQADPLFGWSHIPNSTGRHRKPTDFDVFYHIDSFGHRITSASDELPKILLLGGSFTFGHGVKDNEAYPARLQQHWPTYKIINAAVNGWGTSQALLKLTQQLKQEPTIRLVIYGFMTHHLQRNYLRQSWLKQMMKNRQRRNPYFKLEKGELVFQGLADYEKDGQPASIELDRMELMMTHKLLERIKQICDAQSIPILFVYLPDGTQNHLYTDLAAIFDHAVDLRPIVNYSENRFVYDYHLNATGHRLIAQALQTFLEEKHLVEAQ
jgi:lysophospholipase L1-like esterase